MKKKNIAYIIAFFGVIVILVSIFLYINRFVDVKINEGQFFDDAGRRLGSCKIESKMHAYADMPVHTTYYYNLDGSYIGRCKGDGIGCWSSLKKEPKICEPISFQKPCDKSVHPIEFGATAKYDCVVNSE